jgi:hypothetical protein
VWDISSMNYARSLHGLALVLLLAPGPAIGLDRARALAQAVALEAQPTISILPAVSGAPVASTAGGAWLSLGRAAYFGGKLGPGVTALQNHGSLVISTRFSLKVDCHAGPFSPSAEVTLSLASTDPSYGVSVDGARVSSAPLVTLLPCGSVTEHRLEVEISSSKPEGPIDSTVSFSARTKH